MSSRVEVSVSARFEVSFSLPVGVGGLSLNRGYGAENDEYTLQVQVVGDSVEGAEEALQGLRDLLIAALAGENLS